MAELRRKEYAETRPEVRDDILDRVRWGTLGLVDAEGWPLVRPMNFARVGESVYFHGARKGEKAERAGGPASFVAAEPLAWIPSHWRHPEMACPATTYYRSVMVRGPLRLVEDLSEKASALQKMMEKYQPGGGHAAIAAGDPRYRGPLEAIQVTSLSLAEATTKVKVGQNLEPAARRRVFDALLARAEPGDYETACRMAQADPALAAGAPLLPDQEDGLTFVDRPEQVRAAELKGLLDTTYWAAARPLPAVERLLRGSQVVVAALDGGKLAGFARAVTDGAVHAWIFDVVVDPERRGRGIGHRVMRRLLAHPNLRSVRTVRLDTRDRMTFYERLGFVSIGVKNSAGYQATMMTLKRE
ncbi:MAG: GNAT family N-acetyltransferase [Candidatus Wallbacteria bacterium]|nr:GNAT family N-acetyltransferase [Candidatus Wallbacteria bacterium]